MVRRLVLALLCSSFPLYGAGILVTDATKLNVTDTLNWSQFGSDQSSVWQNFFGMTSTLVSGSTFSDSFAGRIQYGGGTILKAGVDYQTTPGKGIINDDALLSTDGNGSVTLSLSGTYGIGTYIDSPGIGGFTARIQAFAGLNSVLDTTVKSDLAGDPLFIGVLDTKSDITKVIFSLMSAPPGFTTGNFVLDRVLFQNTSVAAVPFVAPIVPLVSAPVLDNPEPGMMSLMALGCVALGLKLRKRAAI